MVAVLALAIIYFLAGKFGLSLAFVNASASAVWPPTGISLAALLLFGYRLWPGIFVGAFLVNIATQGSVATSLGIAAGNTLEALAATWLVSRFAGGPKFFERVRTIFKFIALAALLSTVVSATIGVTTLWLGGFAVWEEYSTVWLTWWIGDASSNLIIAPLLVIWARRPFLHFSPKQILEIAVVFGIAFLFGVVIFLGGIPFFARNQLKYPRARPAALGRVPGRTPRRDDDCGFALRYGAVGRDSRRRPVCDA
jgi:integral membrane sensor domain MASE1